LLKAIAQDMTTKLRPLLGRAIEAMKTLLRALGALEKVEAPTGTGGAIG
jgi:hypothetical protein